MVIRRLLPLTGLALVTIATAVVFWPKDIPSEASGVIAIAASAGSLHTCAVLTGGGVKCWGSNSSGQLGNGRTTFSEPVPVGVVGLDSGVVQISSGGDHTCALTDAGAVKCWGSNAVGELGDGTTTDSPTPVDAAGLGSGIRTVRAGGSHTCAVKSGGSLVCWGANGDGELGDGSTDNRLEPVDVRGLSSGVFDVATGNFHTCAITEFRGLKCWGDNIDGQLGIGTTENSDVPIDVEVPGSVVSVAAGFKHTCVVDVHGYVLCWGDNSYGQLGDGTTNRRTRPVYVQGPADAVAVTAGGEHTCAVTTAGGVKCWGDNFFGQLGDGGTCGRICTAPTDVTGLDNVVAISAGEVHTCALTGDGKVMCWGANGLGQLGDGTTTNRTTPVETTLKPVLGDVNCDGIVNSIDAALILQFVAGLVSSLPCAQNADVNHDGQVNSIDAAIILQYTAGLISHL